MHLYPLLVARGDELRALIRNPAHEEELRLAGAAPVLCDLELAAGDAIAAAIAGSDAVVFAAGAGPGSGAARKRTMDRDGAAKLIAACRHADIERYVMISAMGAPDAPADPSDDDVFAVYLRAKADADAALAASGLAFTIVRPGGLTDAPPTGRVQIAERLSRGTVSRADVAAVIAEVLHDPATIGRSFDLVAGERPVAEAIAAL